MKKLLYIAIIAGFVIGGCRSPYLLETGELVEADISTSGLMEMIPDYSREMNTISGSGRALVSQPGSSDRVTLEFHSNRDASLVTARNRLGIEGARILVEDDSVLIYNRVDNIAEKVSLKDGNLSQVGSLTTINLLDLFHFRITAAEISRIYQDENYYVVITRDQSRLIVNRSDGTILEVHASERADTPYRRIIYEEHQQINGFYLPRKITIFSADESSRVTFLVQQLEINRTLPPLTIILPEGTRILRL